MGRCEGGCYIWGSGCMVVDVRCGDVSVVYFRVLDVMV